MKGNWRIIGENHWKFIVPEGTIMMIKDNCILFRETRLRY